MRVLLLLRGSAGVGKSTWIEENGLKPYTLSADDIRMMYQSPCQMANGKFQIVPNKDKKVWNTLFEILEERMKNGEFTVIDATNSKTSEMTRYKELCSEYRYRIYCVDFTDVPIEEVKRRNKMRPELKQVPEEAIDKMYSRFKTQKVPSGIKVIKPNELNTIWMNPIDFSEYNKIHVIGDIHGCYTVLKYYLKDEIKDDEFYIFTGDYIDRGLENGDVVKFLINIKDRKNVLLLEGNHEKFLRKYGNSKTTMSKEFEFVTKKQLIDAEINKKDIRQLYRKFAQCAFFKYDDKFFLVTHAGLATMPEPLTFISTEQMMQGAGDFKDFEVIANTWVNTTPDNFYQIHGHRNTKRLPIKVNDRVFNLEGHVEFGGDLRCLEITHEEIKGISVPNPVFRIPDETEKDYLNGDVADAILEMRENKYITENIFGHISSFNFTKQAFYEKVWNKQTIQARGLYIDNEKMKVLCRGYKKFFNINEMEETRIENLQRKLQFPITTYVKENGYLGLVGYDEKEDNLLVTTKSNIDGDYATWFKEILTRKHTGEQLEKIKQYSKEHNVTFAFEVIDIVNDPHIIEYTESKIILLDIIHNQLEFKKYSYEDMCNVANEIGLIHKEKAYEIATWQEFYDWYYEVIANDYHYNDTNIEGFVIEDSNGYMTKLKLAYYNFWKFMRGISHETLRKGYTMKTSALTTPLANEFYSYVKKLHDGEDRDLIPTDIITLRRWFYQYKEME